jgi:endonuclease-3
MKTEPTTPTRRIPRSTRTTTAVVDLEDLTPPPSTSTATTTEARRNPKKERSYTPTKIKLSLDKPHPEPKGWRRQYELIERMRERIVAPVDTL